MEGRRIVVIDPSQYTKYEIARILGARALQISLGAPILVKLDNPAKYTFLDIAEMEFKKGVLPITVVRVLPPKIERW